GEPRHLELFLSLAVDLHEFGDRRHLPQQADEIVAPLIERARRPLRMGGPPDLLLDLGDETVDALGGADRLLLLDAYGGALGLIVAQPHVDGAADDEQQADEPDESEREFERESHAHAPRHYRRGRRRGGGGRSGRRGHSITSSARARSDGGMVRPSAFAVLRLTTISKPVGCSTGSLAGSAPLRSLSMYSA